MDVSVLGFPVQKQDIVMSESKQYAYIYIFMREQEGLCVQLNAQKVNKLNKVSLNNFQVKHFEPHGYVSPHRPSCGPQCHNQ